MTRLNRMWWTPLAFVIVTLIALLVTPIVIERRVTEMRDRLANGSERGRVLLNDLEAAFAAELIVRQSPGAEQHVSPALVSDENDLLPTLERVSSDALGQFAELKALISEWQAAPHQELMDSVAVERAREIFAAAERLDAHLAAASDQQRASVRRLEKINVELAVALAPIALIAVAVVIWAGGRVVRYAASAEEQRLEVLRAADARAALLRGVTHDVKNPLGAAAGYAQLLEEGVAGELPPSQTEMIRRIRRLVEQSVDTVTDLLELARADSGGLSIEFARADLAAIARDVVDDHQGAAAERGLLLAFTGNPTEVVTDPRRVRQVLSNLLSNAIKYTPAGGHVGVRVGGDAADEKRIAIRVEDDGPGIPAELRSRVFEEFFRVKPDAASARGNGLGLAISRRIARLLGGDVTYTPGAPRGSVFILWLDGRPTERTSASA